MCIMSMINFPSRAATPLNISSPLDTLRIGQEPVIIAMYGPSTGTSTTRTDILALSEGGEGDEHTCDILALSGGGSFGSVQLGVLDSLITSKKIPDRFDLMTGISAGGINVGFLAHFDNISSALPEMYKISSSLQTKDIYTRHYFGILTQWSIYDTTPLETTIRNTLNSLIQTKNPVKTLVGATNMYTETLEVFDFNGLSLEDKIQVLMSTGAIPIVFPPIRYKDTLYIDGGTISNEIITQSTGELNCSFYNITYINARPPLVKNNNKVNNVFKYIGTLITLILSTFDNQAAEFTTCPYPRGIINMCFPTSQELLKYNRLIFDNGEELYNLGKAHNKCVQYQLC